MQITKQNFEKLSLKDKGEIVFSVGKYLARREYYMQTLQLYQVYDFFTEVFYNPGTNKITNIKVLQDQKTLDRYIDSERKKI